MKHMLPFATLLIAACLDTEKEDPDESEEEEVSSSFQPEEGSWNFNVTITEDSCGFFSGESELDTGEEATAEVLSLSNTGSGTFSITLDGGTDELGQELEDNVFICSLSEQSFTCDASITEIELSETSIVYQEMNFSGAFSTSSSFTGNTQLDLTCEGDDCSMLSDFGLTVPCSSSGAATADFAE